MIPNLVALNIYDRLDAIFEKTKAACQGLRADDAQAIWDALQTVKREAEEAQRILPGVICEDECPNNLWQDYQRYRKQGLALMERMR